MMRRAVCSGLVDGRPLRLATVIRRIPPEGAGALPTPFVGPTRASHARAQFEVPRAVFIIIT